VKKDKKALEESEGLRKYVVVTGRTQRSCALETNELSRAKHEAFVLAHLFPTIYKRVETTPHESRKWVTV
jgi:hypothetical protein